MSSSESLVSIAFFAVSLFHLLIRRFFQQSFFLRLVAVVAHVVIFAHVAAPSLAQDGLPAHVARVLERFPPNRRFIHLFSSSLLFLLLSFPRNTRRCTHEGDTRSDVKVVSHERKVRFLPLEISTHTLSLSFEKKVFSLSLTPFRARRRLPRPPPPPPERRLCFRKAFLVRSVKARTKDDVNDDDDDDDKGPFFYRTFFFLFFLPKKVPSKKHPCVHI